MRLAFIGGWGHHYLRALLTHPNGLAAQAAAAGDGVDDARAKEFASKLPDARWFDDAGEMLDRFKPDLLSVGAVYGRNGDWIAAALERKIRVVSDKPVAATWPQLERIESILSATGGTLISEFPFRSTRAFRAARSAVMSGAIGQVVLATAQKSYRWGSRPAWYSNRDLYGGTILWVASHAIDIIPFITGNTYQNVWGRAGNVAHPELPQFEDHTVCVFEMNGGASAVVHADFARPDAAAGHGDDRLRIAGSRGVLEVRQDTCRLVTHDRREEEIADRVEVRPTHLELLDAAIGHNDQIYSTAQSLHTARILLHARDAADEQRLIQLG